MKIEIEFTLNGALQRLEVPAHARLIDVLRDTLGETGTKEGCGEGECGACTVLVNDVAINACLFPAPEVHGATVLTVEGLTQGIGSLSPVQQAYLDNGGAQCGFCSPGMVMSTVALLKKNPDPSPDEIRTALTGNLCRCTGYVQIIESVQAASKEACQGMAR